MLQSAIIRDIAHRKAENVARVVPTRNSLSDCSMSRKLTEELVLMLMLREKKRRGSLRAFLDGLGYRFTKKDDLWFLL